MRCDKKALLLSFCNVLYAHVLLAGEATVVTRWDPNKSGNRERTEWLVLGLVGLGLGLELGLGLVVS